MDQYARPSSGVFEQRFIGLRCHARILADLHGIDQHRSAAVARAGTVFGNDGAIAGDHLFDIRARARIGAWHSVRRLVGSGRRRLAGSLACGLFGRRRFGALQPLAPKGGIERKAAYREKAQTGSNATEAQHTRTPATGFAVAPQRRMQVRSQFSRPLQNRETAERVKAGRVPGLAMINYLATTALSGFGGKAGSVFLPRRRSSA